MNPENNATGRLHSILSDLRNQAGKGPERDLWAQVFEVDSDDTDTILRTMAEVVALIPKSKAEIGRLVDVDHQLHLAPFDKIDRYFSNVNLEGGANKWSQQVDEATLVSLRITADRVAREVQDEILTDEQLTEIQTNVEELTSQVEDSDLPDALRDAVLSSLDDIRWAFRTYRIRGLDGLQTAVERVVGTLVVHPTEVQQAQRSAKETLASILGTLSHINSVISTARYSQAALPIVEDATRMLLGG